MLGTQRIHAFRKGPFEQATDKDRSPDTGDAGKTPAPRVVCVSCGHVVTDRAQAIQIEGLHRHVRINPHGYEHHFGCYRAAPGVVGAGALQATFSWFAGYAWQLAYCGGCAVHLGWIFVGEGDGFVGLLAAQVREAEDDETST